MTGFMGCDGKVGQGGPSGRRRRDSSAPRARLRGGDPLLGGRPSAPGHAGRESSALLTCYERYPTERSRRLP